MLSSDCASPNPRGRRSLCFGRDLRGGEHPLKLHHRRVRFAERVTEIFEGVLEKSNGEPHIAERLAATEEVIELCRLPVEAIHFFVNGERALVEVDGPPEIVLLAITEAELAELSSLPFGALQFLVHGERTMVKADGLRNVAELAVSEPEIAE